eukprot:4427338-Prymnesium_polylepis.1
MNLQATCTNNDISPLAGGAVDLRGAAADAVHAGRRARQGWLGRRARGCATPGHVQGHQGAPQDHQQAAEGDRRAHRRRR